MDDLEAAVRARLRHCISALEREGYDRALVGSVMGGMALAMVRNVGGDEAAAVLIDSLRRGLAEAQAGARH